VQADAATRRTAVKREIDFDERGIDMSPPS
jgi:hypothetical protein